MDLIVTTLVILKANNIITSCPCSKTILIINTFSGRSWKDWLEKDTSTLFGVFWAVSMKYENDNCLKFPVTLFSLNDSKDTPWIHQLKAKNWSVLIFLKNFIRQLYFCNRTPYILHHTSTNWIILHTVQVSNVLKLLNLTVMFWDFSTYYNVLLGFTRTSPSIRTGFSMVSNRSHGQLFVGRQKYSLDTSASSMKIYTLHSLQQFNFRTLQLLHRL